MLVTLLSSVNGGSGNGLGIAAAKTALNAALSVCAHDDDVGSSPFCTSENQIGQSAHQGLIRHLLGA